MLKILPYTIFGFILALACVGSLEYASSSDKGGVAAIDESEFEPSELKTIKIFQKASKSVVFITSKQRVRSNYFSLFGSPFQDQVREGSGSGFLWDKKGHIVTNYHVVVGADSLTVTLPDNTEWDAIVVGSAPDCDLAVLEIDAPEEKLYALEIGRSSNLRVGQKVLAIGNPFGLDQSLTTGVVSALNRQIKSMAGHTIDGMIQTDAAINPGNSGGPLLDSKGKLIGVNAAILSPSGSSAGIGFAVPVNTVSRVVPQLIKNIRPGLGIKPLNDLLTKKYGIKGVVIDEVEPNSAADRAGLKGIQVDRRGNYYFGDIITGIEGHSVTNIEELLDLIRQYNINDTIKVHLLRYGKEAVTVKVTLQALSVR